MRHCRISTINILNPQTSIEYILAFIFDANNTNSPFFGYGTDVLNGFTNDKMVSNERVNISQKNMRMEHIKALTKQIGILLIIKYN